jgi:LPXTG-motif cell wall-anchored protein
MNARQTRKLFAGAGLISMLLGALMVVAPTGAGADEVTPPQTDPHQVYDSNVLCNYAGKGNVVGLGYDHEISFGSITGSDDYDSPVVDGVSFDSTVINGVRYLEWTSETHHILAVIVKQANGAAVFDYEPDGAKAGTVFVATGNDQTGVSHVGFCYGEEPGLTVTKDVASEEQADLTVPFSVTVSGTGGKTQDLKDGDAISIPVASGTYTITEALPDGWETPTLTCGEAAVSAATGGGWTVSVTEVDVDCILTNTPEDPGPELTVRKVVGNVEPASWTYDFEICDDSDVRDETFQTAEVLEEDCTDFDLSRNDPQTQVAEHEKSFGPGTYRIAELEEGVTPTIVCTDSEGTVGVVNGSEVTEVDVTELDVLCVFTNPGDTPPPGPQDLPQSLTVVKTNVGAFPSAWSVDFEIEGPTDQDFNLSSSTGPSATSTVFSVGEGVYVISEDVLGLSEELTASLQSLACTENGVAFGGFSRVGNAARVVLADGDNVVCTFVNSYTQVAPNEVERASIVIDKAVQGPAPTAWSFAFTGTGGIAGFDLTNEDPSESLTVDAGTYTITETASAGSELVAVTCGDAVVNVDLGTRSVTFDLDEGETVSCTFRNRYPTPPAPTPPAVAGDVVTRQLPRTGSETTDLAGFGAGFLLLGAGLIIISRAHRYSVTS